jgi:hypothetical protein
LSSALDALVPLRLNAANLEFYQGNTREAYSLYTDVYHRAVDCDYTEFKTELEACLGLAALQLRDAAAARRWLAACDTREESLGGMQERFKVEWFWGYCHRREDPVAVYERLRRVAANQELFDRVGSLKLRWLAEITVPSAGKDPNREMKAKTRNELSEAGLGWFVHFSDRWRRLADGCSF